MFREALEKINEQTEGALGSLIMGTDGIAVEKSLLTEGIEMNLDVAAAEVTSLVRTAQRSGRDTGMGATKELFLSYERMNVIARLVSHEYFLVLALKPDGNIGRGRFELRKAELDLAREFAV